MAPRGRKKKTGLGRIDAAYDALMPLGFARDEIRKTIASLLKVYGGAEGGPEGWIFIEEGCYKLVIDTILEKQEQFKIEGGSATSGALEISEPVVDAGDASLHPKVIKNGLNPGEFALTSGAPDELPAVAVDASPSVLVAVKVEDESPSVLPAANAGDPAPSVHSSVAENMSPSMLPQASPCVMTGNVGPGPGGLQQPKEVARRRRPPCYGWISETESEED